MVCAVRESPNIPPVACKKLPPPAKTAAPVATPIAASPIELAVSPTLAKFPPVAEAKLLYNRSLALIKPLSVPCIRFHAMNKPAVPPPNNRMALPLFAPINTNPITNDIRSELMSVWMKSSKTNSRDAHAIGSVRMKKPNRVAMNMLKKAIPKEAARMKCTICSTPAKTAKSIPVNKRATPCKARAMDA